ncbi:receptor-mediated endocytosis protein 6 homolog isoform X2 [Planococcus citri]|uniref:receptor-mediated endocytosis protein 6 homolog isoform X2 n=1 Tax=Planococcus citri TaxID=170843 RepID=UPI0031F9A8B8
MVVPNSIEDPEKLSLICQLTDLATSLRQERLFVISEQHHLQDLNINVNKSWYDLTKLVWVTWQQRICINKLSVSHCDFTPASCCSNIGILDNTEFEEAHKILSYQSNLHCTQLLNYLKQRPQLIAQCLSVINQTQSDFLAAVIESIILGLYGCCLLPEDKALVLELLLHLTHLQLVPAEDPLRLIRHGSCAFARLYSLFHEGLYSAQLFLTAALHSPIMHLLMEDEKFLDIDPDKALIRFATAERLKMFGTEGTPEYKNSLQKYRLWTINKLVAITNKFIDNIKAHIHCFPSSICWLVRHIYNLLANTRKLEEKQIFALCVDLVITSFICPAIVNPESYGIIDAPVSYIARFNLMQVAKILQMLAMRKYEPVEAKVADLYKHFDEDCLSSIINILLEDALHKVELDKEPSNLETNDQLKQMAYNVKAFFTEQQLHNLIIFLQSALTNDMLPKKEKIRLEELISAVATDFSPVPSTSNCNNVVTLAPPSNRNVNGDSSPITLAKRQINIISKAVNRTKQSAAAVASSVLNSDNNDTEYQSRERERDFVSPNRDLETVLVFALEDDSEMGIIGLLTEQQVLEEGQSINMIESNCDPLLNVNSCVEPATSQTKTLSTCCSSQDGEEGVSENGSNESEDSSSIDLEAEDQNDNLSDMISANVSGRGTPNISGRDTPSSQIMENENEEANPMERAVPLPPQSQAKQPRFDLDDKFGKFEVKNLPHSGDETVSLVSDTWSTDVLASDSENIDQNQSNHNLSNANSVFSSSDALALLQNSSFSPLVDISETASEGWSTDVVVSDSDRVTEVDTDDTASVARSDITTRSEVESRGEGVDINAEDMPSTSNAASASHLLFQKEDSGNLIHVIGSEEVPDCAASLNCDSKTRPNLLSNLSQSSTGSQSRSSSSHQASMDSEDIRGIGGDIASVSMSSAASVSSSCSSAGNADNDHVQSKQFSFSDHASSSSQVVSFTSNASSSSVTITTTACSSSVNMGNGCAIISLNERSTSNRSSSSSAVVKSISFDKTAEKGDKDDDKNKQRSGFLNKLNIFKNRRGRDSSSQWSESTSGSLAVQFTNNAKMLQEQQNASKVRSNSRYDSNKLKPSYTSNGMSRGTVFYTSTSTSDDILNKYRKQPNDPSTSASVDLPDGVSRNENGPSVDGVAVNVQNEDESELNIHCEKFKFENAKRKLRSVLSNAEIQQLPCANNDLRSLKEAWCQQPNVLVAFLQLQLAEAIHLKDRSLIAHLHETVRCVKSFNDQKCLYLLETLKKEYKARAPYLSYLMRCRQTLLSITAHLNRLTKRVKCQQDVCKNFFASICVRLFLQKREQLLLQFATEFHSLTLADEKSDLLRNFLSTLEKHVDNDSTWQGVNEQQLESIKVAIERSVISRVYMYAMFPNGDGDISRDEVLHEHIKKLSKIITPNHKYLCIPKKYHYECPWPAAQEELTAMSAYKTPAEKLDCILRCTQTIQNLLCLACNNSVPSADILVPVLVFVIIMANPPSLLSTIQYINSFYETRLKGEEQYWWVQFTSAVEYIKTMEYTS